MRTYAGYLKKVLHIFTGGNIDEEARRAGSDGSMSASGSAGPGFNPWQVSKFSFENFQPWGCSMYVEKAYSTVDSNSSVKRGR